MKIGPAWAWPALVGVWAVALAAGLASRPLMPVDETRYLSVAWNMWREHEFLVPLLNGDPYSHKPPLLFWLINAGWAVFGVNETWGRLVAPIAGLAAALLTVRLARVLWPARPNIGLIAGMLLMSSGYWLIFSTLTMFDMLVVATSVAAITGIAGAAGGGGWRSWAVVALAGGIGVLAKGPVALLPIACVALLAPLWRRTPAPRWSQWYLATIAALAAAAAIGLAWALPAAISGGDAYARSILWDQTSGRVVTSFAHVRPIWWYLPLLPLLALPAVLWLPLWRGSRSACHAIDEGIRLCVVWAGAVLIAMSLISGKQPHYLLPVFPALALLGARAAEAAGTVGRWDRLPLVLFWGMLGLAGLALPLLAGRGALPAEMIDLSPWIGVAFLAMSVATMWPSRLQAGTGTAWLMTSVLFAVVLVNLGFHGTIGSSYDLAPIARAVADYQRAGRPIVLIDGFDGQLDFSGRLPQRIPVISSQEVDAWAGMNPEGYVVRKQKQAPDRSDYVTMQRIRGSYLVVWPSLVLADRLQAIQGRAETRHLSPDTWEVGAIQ